MFQVLDHHTRRNAEEGRVVGALLGSVQSDGTVQLKNAFPMNHDDVTHSPQAQVQGHTDADTGARAITAMGRGLRTDTNMPTYHTHTHTQEFNHFFNTMADLHHRVNAREQVRLCVCVAACVHISSRMCTCMLVFVSLSLSEYPIPCPFFSVSAPFPCLRVGVVSLVFPCGEAKMGGSGKRKWARPTQS